jgi:hypothetical protein
VVIVLSDNVSEGEYVHKREIDARRECIDYQSYLEDYIVRTFQFRGFGTSTRMKISSNLPIPQQHILRNYLPRYQRTSLKSSNLNLEGPCDPQKST